MNATHVKATGIGRGSALVESLIAMGVLSIAIPLVFGALAESSKSGISSTAQARSSAMIAACMDEIQASRDGTPQFFTATAAQQTFPVNGDVWALAFSPQGQPIGKLGKSDYTRGTRRLNGQEIRYVASLSAAKTTSIPDATPMLSARIAIEYPAAAPAAKRESIDFFTRIP